MTEMTPQDELKEAITGAVARGWCAKANEEKEFDADLANAIFAEVWAEVAAYLRASGE